MPEYTVRDPQTGRSITIRGTSPPTEGELLEIFAAVGTKGPEQQLSRLTTWADRAGLNKPTDSRVLGFLRGSGAAAADMAEGATSGILSTAFHGGDLIRRGLGMERVIESPEAQAAMRAPDSVAGMIGKGGEQAAEFAVPLSRLSKSVSALSWLSRMAAEGAAGAGTAAVQTGGDPTAMAAGAVLPAAGSIVYKGGKAVVGAVRNAAAGAAEDGVGGAIAGMTRAAVPVEPAAAMVQALKPRNTRVNFSKGLGLAMPEIKASEQTLGKPIESVDDLLAATKNAKKRIWSQYEQMSGPQKAMQAQVDLSDVADAIESSIPKRVQMQNPSQAEGVRKIAAAYRTGTFSLEDAETLLRETNADLEAYYNKFPAARGRATLTNPDTAQTVAEAEALRTAIYRKLDAAGEGQAAAELKRRYGALLEVEDAAMRRANVAARQQPESLSEQIGKVRAAADMARGTWRVLHGDFSGAADIAAARAGTATAKYLKEQQTTNALIRRAFASFKGAPVTVPMPAQPRIAGLLPKANTRLGGGADPSYVRAVPGQYARRAPAGLLPPKSSGPVVPSSGTPPTLPATPAAPDRSGISVVKAKPTAYEFVPGRGKTGRESWRMQPKSFSSDPSASAASAAMSAESPDVAKALRWMQAEMENVEYTSKYFNDPGTRAGGDHLITGGSGGAPIYQDIVGNKMSASRGDVQKAIREVLDGSGKPSKLKQSILEVASGLASGDKSLTRKMMLPPSAAQTAEEMAQQYDEDVFARLSDDVADLGPSSGGGREPGEEGRIAMRALLALGAGSGAAAGAAGMRRGQRRQAR